MPKGITRNQSSWFQQMADNKDIVEEVKKEAEAMDNIPTRAEIIMEF